MWKQWRDICQQARWRCAHTQYVAKQEVMTSIRHGPAFWILTKRSMSWTMRATTPHFLSSDIWVTSCCAESCVVTVADNSICIENCVLFRLQAPQWVKIFTTKKTVCRSCAIKNQEGSENIKHRSNRDLKQINDVSKSDVMNRETTAKAKVAKKRLFQNDWSRQSPADFLSKCYNILKNNTGGQNYGSGWQAWKRWPFSAFQNTIPFQTVGETPRRVTEISERATSTVFIHHQAQHDTPAHLHHSHTWR